MGAACSFVGVSLAGAVFTSSGLFGSFFAMRFTSLLIFCNKKGPHFSVRPGGDCAVPPFDFGPTWPEVRAYADTSFFVMGMKKGPDC